MVPPNPFSDDLYERLGATPQMTPAELHACWLAAMKAFHPDLAANAPDSVHAHLNVVAARLNEAHDVLRDDVTRAAYRRTGTYTRTAPRADTPRGARAAPPRQSPPPRTPPHRPPPTPPRDEHPGAAPPPPGARTTSPAPPAPGGITGDDAFSALLPVLRYVGRLFLGVFIAIAMFDAVRTGSPVHGLEFAVDTLIARPLEGLAIVVAVAVFGLLMLIMFVLGAALLLLDASRSPRR